jgi:hypothetical protein
MSGLSFTEIGVAVGVDQKDVSDKLIIYAMNLVSGKSVNGMTDTSADQKEENFINTLSVLLQTFFQFRFKHL